MALMGFRSFRCKHSMEHALISLTKTIKKYLDDGEIVRVVFIVHRKPLTL